MKNFLTKFTALFAVICIIVFTAASCGSSTNDSIGYAGESDYYENGLSYKKSYDLEISDADYADEEATSEVYEQKLIKYQHLTLETLDFDTSVSAIESLTKSFGGYVSDSEISNSGSYGSYRPTSASFTVRIPASNLNEFVSSIPDSCKCSVKSSTLQTEEITDEYFGLKARYDALVESEAKLNELAEKAETLADLLTIQNQLTDIREEINSVSSKIQYYDKAVSMSYVYITLYYVEELTPEAEPTFIDKIGDAFKGSIEVFGDILQFMSIAIIYLLPYIIIAGIIVAIILVLSHKAKKKKENNTNDK